MELTRYQNINQQVPVSGHNIIPYLLSLSEYMQNSGIEIMPYPKIIVSNKALSSLIKFKILILV
jgi:hypothetical protein